MKKKEFVLSDHGEIEVKRLIENGVTALQRYRRAKILNTKGLKSLRNSKLYTNDYFFDFGFLFQTNVKAPESGVTLFLALMPGGDMGVRFPEATVPSARRRAFTLYTIYYSQSETKLKC